MEAPPLSRIVDGRTRIDLLMYLREAFLNVYSKLTFIYYNH